jgi:hypothetical protein
MRRLPRVGETRIWERKGAAMKKKNRKSQRREAVRELAPRLQSVQVCRTAGSPATRYPSRPCGGSTRRTGSTACRSRRWRTAHAAALAGRRAGRALARRRLPRARPTHRGQSRPLRIHALLDDASRFILAIEARHTEREADMLQLLVKALASTGRPTSSTSTTARLQDPSGQGGHRGVP